MSVRRNISLMIAALSVLLCSACAEIDKPGDEGWTDLGGDRPVRFNSSLATKTKDNSDLPDGTHFGVFAFLQNGVIGSYTGTWSDLATKHWTPNFMFNEDVEFDADGSTYTYSPLKYWPNNSENTISFWAYCPYSSSPDLLTAGMNDAYSKTSIGLPDFRFTITDGETDLLFSDLVEDMSKPASDAAVNFTFHHKLSQLIVNIKKIDTAVPEKYTVTLKSIRLDGIYLTAVRRSAGWSDWSNPDSFSLFSGETNITTDDRAVANVILLPQHFSGEDAMLHIEYTIKHSGMTQARTVLYNVPLSKVFENVSSHWAEDTKYTINISITPHDPIEFTVTWSSWGDAYNYHITS